MPVHYTPRRETKASGTRTGAHRGVIPPSKCIRNSIIPRVGPAALRESYPQRAIHYLSLSGRRQRKLAN